VLVNDLAFLHYGEWYGKKYLHFIKMNEPVFLQKAKTIVVFSNVLKNEIHQQYKIDNNKITVANPFALPNFQPANPEVMEQVKEQYTEGKEYFLFSGAIHPASNLTNLLKAFSLFKKRQKTNMQFIIASANFSADKTFIDSLKLYKYRNEIKLLENLDENSLQKITASAYACINLSPLQTDIASLLNAMQCKVPVIAGNFYAAIETFQDAALYANETVPEAIAEKLMLLYKDENQRKEFIQKGLNQSAKFTLNNMAVPLWQNITSIIDAI
jgi:glycosyltransferase involved in cell wall biosynthesis